MKKFLTNILLILFIIAMILASIIYLDFFKVFRSYDDYNFNSLVVPNREVVTTRTYINNRKHEKFNSFILGSSRTLSFKLKEWQQYLPEGAIPYHFDASGESIYGIYNKLRFIEENGDKIDNALIIIDRISLKLTKNRKGPIAISPPEISKESRLSFYMTFVKASLDPKFLLAYTDYSIFQKPRKYMKNIITTDNKNYSDPINSDFTIGTDEIIKKDSINYYKKLIDKGEFYNRPPKVILNYQLSSVGEQYLNDIYEILKKNKASYKIIIPPLYDQIPISIKNLQFLKKVFGKNNVYDFSGKNNFTEPISNFYESQHYKPYVANEMLEIIYKDQ